MSNRTNTEYMQLAGRFLGEEIYRDSASDDWVTESGVRISSREIMMAQASPSEFAAILQAKMRERDARTMKSVPLTYNDITRSTVPAFAQKYEETWIDEGEMSRKQNAPPLDVEKFRKQIAEIERSTRDWAGKAKQQVRFREQYEQEIRRREMDEQNRSREWYESQRIIAPPGSELRGVLNEINDLRRMLSNNEIAIDRVSRQVYEVREVVFKIAEMLEKGVLFSGGKGVGPKGRRYSKD